MKLSGQSTVLGWCVGDLNRVNSTLTNYLSVCIGLFEEIMLIQTDIKSVTGEHTKDAH
jgi:hypothetical protein